ELSRLSVPVCCAAEVRRNDMLASRIANRRAGIRSGVLFYTLGRNTLACGIS
ncbi:hypothetical protein GWI33_021542, partial [Rhynchophorus ferrugineus]